MSGSFGYQNLSSIFKPATLAHACLSLHLFVHLCPFFFVRAKIIIWALFISF